LHEVCILIAAYNAERWLAESLESSLAQRGVDFEIVVVNDGSTDGTADILADYERRHGDRIRAVHQPSAGVSAARNAGFDAADAEFVTVLDADDRMHPHRCRVEVEGLRRFADTLFSICARWSFEDGCNEGSISMRPEPLAGTSEPGFYRIEDPITTLLRAGESPGTATCTSRLEFSRTIGRFDEQQSSFVDGDRWIRTAHHRSIVYCSLALHYRRLHGESLSHSRPERFANITRALDKARAHWDDYSPAQQQALTTFERGIGIASAKAALLAGDARRARGILRANYQRLKSAYWWKVYLAALLPQGLFRAANRARQNLGKPEFVSRKEVESIDAFEVLGLT